MVKIFDGGINVMESIYANKGQYRLLGQRYDPFEDEVIKETPIKRSNVKCEGTQLLIIIQIMACLVIFMVVIAIKAIGGATFDTVRDWYLKNMNDSLIAGEDVKNYRSTIGSNFFVDGKETPLDKGLNFTNSGSLPIGSLPLLLSVKIEKPLGEGVLTSRFGKRINPITHLPENHAGMDIAAGKGTPIVSVMPGVVEKAEKSRSYGKYLLIDHGNNIKTRYAHCNDIKVAAGDYVARGQQIAMVGSSGAATGDHLHFEIDVGGVKYDPQPLLYGNYV